MLCCLVVSYTQKPSGFKAVIKSIFKTNLGKIHLLCRGGGMKMLRGGTEIFSGIKGGALKVLDILKGGL